MTIAHCKSTLLELIADPSNRVISLVGKWGTGKSYLWQQVRETTAHEPARKAPYVSLFGISNIAELKLRIIQECLADGGKATVKVLAEYGGPIKGILKAFSSRFSVLDEVTLLAAPKLLRDRFIVIDDIERKHAQLSIDEILGFIDDLTQRKGCRVLLILNEDKLSDKSLWDQLREKLIDNEVRLDTSPGEAFDIAHNIIPTNFKEAIRRCIEVCSVSNIRVICKIIKVVNKVLATYTTLAPGIVNRVIPSSVLLAAIYYKGLENGPSQEFVLNFSSDVSAFREAVRDEEVGPPTEDDKANSRWRLLLEQLQIRCVDEFETIVAEFLQSGLLDDSAVRKIVGRYAADAETIETRERLEKFMFRCTWHPELPEAMLVEEARSFLNSVAHLDASAATALHDLLAKMDGGSALAEELLNLWLRHFRTIASNKDWSRSEELSLFGLHLHPAIKSELDAVFRRSRANMTISDAYQHILTSNGWSRDQESVLKSASVEDFASAMTTLSGQELKLFLLKSMDLYVNRATYEQHFGSAMQNFLLACRLICVQTPTSRLAVLLKRLFVDSKVGADLQPSSINNEVTI